MYRGHQAPHTVNPDRKEKRGLGPRPFRAGGPGRPRTLRSIKQRRGPQAPVSFVKEEEAEGLR